VHGARVSSRQVSAVKEAEPLAAGAAASGLAQRTYEVVAAGSHAFAATTAGLTVYDISSPAKPEVVTSLYFPGSANGVAVAVKRAFLAMGPEGLRVIDISNPAHPRLIGALDTDGSVNATAFLADQAGNVKISSDEAEATGARSDRQVVIADGAGGMKVVNVAEDGAIRVISSLDTGRHAVHVAVSDDNLIAAAEEDDGVGLYRLGADGQLVQLSTTPLFGTARGVAFSGTRCFVAAGLAGVLTLDVANPARPKLIGSFPAKHYARGVSVQGGTILLADSQAGLRLIQEGDETQRPAHKTLGTFDTGSSANRVSRLGTLALVAIDAGGIRLVDVSDPKNPKGY
jgi:hypothetical protein